MSTNEGAYRMGWILTVFDLPVGTAEQRTQARKFRDWLLKDGYFMMQFSVYARPCVNADHLQKHAARINKYAPDSGFVRVLFLTDRQWGMSINIIGDKSYLKNRTHEAQVPEQILFW